jgi:DtxR family Mn-dependent transcriptional regulator
MLSRSIEDYIKAIYALEVEEQKASTKQIAQRLGVKMASVTGMIKHLAAEGYVTHTPYYAVHLSDQGRGVALDLIRRHRLIELFLSRTLGLPWDEVHNDAEVLEHVVSERLVERIHEFLGFPRFDPPGSPIPGRDGSSAPPRGVRLDEMTVGQRGTIVEVSDRDPEFLRYLTGLRLSIGSAVRIRERAPFNGPITLAVGSRIIAIGHEAGARIRVGVAEPTSPKRRRKRREGRG